MRAFFPAELWPVPVLLLLGIMAALAYPAARHAQAKGYSFWLFELTGILFGFLVPLILMAVLPAREGSARWKQQNEGAVR
ncbi:hypothetical protein HLV37_05810 [Eggerthellaceae bacterium zg-1084]|uniref:hypothetical protein n=1 Tax=Berryella wangjianweii TaxID=2734634 RepID=UPI0015542683|nr:hypothetical protein [Berryella wangjianweii]NPD31378.1 hypothetical protein [Berryella wangjianweii]